MSNITAFCRGCQKLGVPKRDCFDTLDLQQLRDLSKVYETLLALSRVVSTGLPEWSGPLLVSKKQAEQHTKLRSPERRTSWGTTSSRARVLPRDASKRRDSSPPQRPPNSPPPKQHQHGDDSATPERTTIANAASLAPPRPSAAAIAAFAAASPAATPPPETARRDVETFKDAPAFSLTEWIEKEGLSKYALQLITVAEDVSDLREMTDADVEDMVKAAAMPKLKARRFRKALQDLGAAVSAV